MSDACCAPPPISSLESTLAIYRRVLWVVLLVNAVMFGIEVVSGLFAQSVALQADALDFLGDAANYGIAIFVLGHSLRWRAGTALLKGVAMAGFGVFVLSLAIYRTFVVGEPNASLMGSVGVLALLANVFCAVLLYHHRAGDSNMRAVWLCSRNDALGNILVVAAAGGVGLSGTGWPDLGVAVVIAGLALWGASEVIKHAVHELRQDAQLVPAE
ncbi:MAG TPA: cation transporter [Sneathiellales bacterium]|nr:cation transporter [Sneathiellales bacterium]